MATWQDYTELFAADFQPVITALAATYEADFEISDYDTFAAQSSDTIRTQLVSLGSNNPFLLAYATYLLEQAAGVSPEGDGALTAYQLTMLKMAPEEMQSFGKLENYFEGINSTYEDFQAMSAENLAAEFAPANIASGFWSVTAFALSTRIAVLADAEFGGFVLSLPLAQRTSVESFLKLMVANDTEFNLDALRAMSSKALAGKFKTLTSNPFIRFRWAHELIATVRTLLEEHTPDDALEGQFLSSQGKYMQPGLEALQKSLAAAELATTVSAIGQLWLDALVGHMTNWSSGHLFFHSVASQLVANLKDYDRTLAEAARQPVMSIAFQIRPTNPNARPLGGLLVRVMNTVPTPAVELGTRMLDYSGIAYIQYEGSVASTLTLTFEVMTADEVSLVTSGGLSFDPATQKSIEVEVAVPAVPFHYVGVLAMATELGVTIPTALHSLMEGIDAETLDRVREIGGLAGRSEPAIVDNLNVAKWIDQHAMLETIESNAALREYLIAEGYPSISKIAGETRASFVTELSGAIYGEVTLAGVYLKAAKVDAVASHLWVAKGAGHASNYKNSMPASVALQQLYAKQCDCEECRSGVSPLAYLAALLDYGTKYVKLGKNPVDVDWFQNHFHQGYCELPADCSAVEKRVCQVRIAIEVLRQYLGSVDLPYARKKAYLERTYRLLLNQSGVTVDEMRLVSQNAYPGGNYDSLQDTIAARLGIDPLKVGFFYLDSTGLIPSLNEDNLELLFGFQSTLRNPYSDGLLSGSTHLHSWQFKGLDWQKNTDADGKLHLQVTAAPIRVNVYRDSSLGAGYLVASATISAIAPHTAELVAQNDSGLFGRIELGSTYTYGLTADNTIEISVIPRLLAWRLAAQRKRWQSQDWPSNNPYLVADRSLPIIEPDWMGPDDMRVSVVSSTFGYYGPFDIWKHRRSWIDVIMGDLGGLGGALDDCFDYMDDPNWHRKYQATDGVITYSIRPWDSSSIAPFVDWETLFTDIDTHLRSSVAADRAAAVALVTTDLRMTLDSFARFYEIYTKYLLPLGASGLTQVELDDLHGILCQVAKNAYYAVWIAEEDALEVVLSAAQFWVPIHAPKEGQWNKPITSSPFYATAIGMPYIDPVEVGLLDLPDPIFGAAPINLFQTRTVAIASAVTDIYNARNLGTPKHEKMILAALGTLPVHNLKNLLEDLNSLIPGTVTAALVIVNQEYFLTQAEFREAMKPIAKDLALAPNATDSDFEALAKVLVNGWRRRHWGTWRTAEANVFYWKAYKQRLPAWRSSKERRKLWIDGLAVYNRIPLVEPDLIKAGDLVNPEYNGNALLDNPAYLLWRSRNATIEDAGGWLATIVAANFQDNVLGILGIATTDEVEDLQSLYEQNKDVSARLAQLNLNPPRLGVIAKIHRALGNAITPSAAEIADLHAILLQVQKERNYGAWNIAERNTGIYMSPAFFQMAYANYYEFMQYLGAILLPWRSSTAARRDWQDQLSSRIDQAQSLIEGMHSLVKTTEDQVLIMLRDALLMAVGSGGSTLESKGEYMTEKLLLDFRTQCCNETTRVAQAIETLQILFFSIRTGTIIDDYPTLKLDNDDWDNDWKWLSTYGTWRSLMFVYMYPENVLMPSLKDKMSGKLRGIISQVRNSARFTPDMACEVLHDYEDYLKDMADLSLQATVTTTVNVEADGCGMIVGTPKEMDFHFALGGHSKKALYSIVDVGATSADFAQSAWEAVPEMESVYRIIGATVFQTKKGKRYLYLFALKSVVNDQPELAANRLNLSTMRWENDLTDLKIDKESKMETWRAVVAERQSESDPVFIVGRTYESFSTWGPWYNASKHYNLPEITSESIKDRHVVFNCFDDEGVAWKYDKWNSLGFLWMKRFELAGALVNDEGFLTILAAIQFKDGEPWHLGYHSFYTKEGISQLEIQRVIPQAIALNVPVSSIDLQDQTAFSDFLYNSAKLQTVSSPLGVGFKRTLGIVKRNSAEEFDLYFDNGTSVGSTMYWPIKFQRTWYRPGLGLEMPWTQGSNAPSPQNRFHRSLKFEAVTNPPSSTNTMMFAGPCFAFGNAGGILGNPPRLTVQFNQNYLLTLSPVTFLGLASHTLRLNLFVGGNPLVPLLQHASTAISTTRATLLEVLYTANATNTKQNSSYLQEAYYLLPVFLAIELQKGKHYEAALEMFRLVYDFTLPLANRKIWYGLVAEETIATSYDNVLAWLDNPENPHTIAGMRANTYTRFTIFSIVRCMLAMADQEFTTDSPESVPRARVLYQAAIELIKDEIYDLESAGCGALLDDLDALVTDAGWQPEWLRLKAAIASINNHATIDEIVNGFGAYLGGIAAVLANTSLSWEQRIMAAEAIYQFKLDLVGSTPNRLCTVVSDWSIDPNRIDIIMIDNGSGGGMNRLAAPIGDRFLNSLALITGKTKAALITEDSLTWLGEGVNSEPGEALNLSLQQRLKGESGLYEAYYQDQPLNALRTDGNYKRPFIPYRNHYFCVPQNPVPYNLLLHAELNLFKIRHCRNIAGIHRELDPYGAPTDTTSGMPVIGANGEISFPGAVSVPPTPYRYEVVLARAKELVQLAAQAENAMLITLEKLDSERYSLLRARQDMSTAKATVRLQDLRVRESEHEVDAAEMQQAKAQDALEDYKGWIEDGLPKYEKIIIASNIASGVLRSAAAVLDAAYQTTSLMVQNILVPGSQSWGTLMANLLAVETGLNIGAIGAETTAAVSQVYASFEQRKREWTFQAAMSQWDVDIAGQQIKLANDRLRITGQERAIAQMQADHAEETLEFLRTKFTNAELYDWMSGVLQQVYSFYLQHATSMAKIAQQQLAFERQEAPANLILDDYWSPPSDSASVPGVSAGTAVDRRGLTGSARLQMDLTKLDLYSFETEKRKLQLTKTMSLAQLFPAEFEVFRQTGVLTFRTRMDWFDRDFPGHYLRLVKRVRTSVIALVPPGEGIRARLATTGVSRVVVGGDAFQMVVTQRGSESVSLTSPIEATGLFEMLPDRGDMLFPFEGMGVDAQWEFRMYRAANPINFNTIADVLLTFEYTALESFAYEQQVLQSFDNRLHGERAFSFKYLFPDQWYDLQNAALTDTPYVVDFELRRGDFPGLAFLKVESVTLILVTTVQGDAEYRQLELWRQDLTGSDYSVGGLETANAAGVLSTRSTNGQWASFLNAQTPVGKWRLNCSNARLGTPPTAAIPSSVRGLIDDIDAPLVDILLIVGYMGDSPGYV